MKVHVLAEQAADPAFHFLSTIADLVPLTDYTAERRHPMVVLGSAFTAAKDTLKQLCQATYHNPYPLLLLPPWPHNVDLAQVLLSPASMTIEPARDDQIQLLESDLIQKVGQTIFQVRCDQMIKTPLTAGELARNNKGQLVLTRYRPSNATTPIWITTIQLLSRSSRSDPLGRDQLLRAVLELLEKDARPENGEPIITPQNKAPSFDELRLVVLGLTQKKSTNIEELRSFIRERLFVDLEAEHLEATLKYLGDVECVSLAKHIIQVDPSKLDEWIAHLDLRAFLRALQEE